MLACSPPTDKLAHSAEIDISPQETSLIVLGTIQDAGSPHIACKKSCCAGLFDQPDPTRQVVSLGIFDKSTGKTYVLDASPDMSRQLTKLSSWSQAGRSLPDGIFITHAHIGHYTGLMYLGKEAVNASGVPVYAMPRMVDYLRNDGPWSQLVSTGNIELRTLAADSTIVLSDELSVTPLLVPHRDEYSETVGFVVEGPRLSALFIPDIDKWSRWDRDIKALIQEVDYAFVDGTFYDAAEIGYRDVSAIPHPFIIESMDLFADLPEGDRAKVHFIHLNHTNPAIVEESDASKAIDTAGYRVARYGQVVGL